MPLGSPLSVYICTSFVVGVTQYSWTTPLSIVAEFVGGSWGLRRFEHEGGPWFKYVLSFTGRMVHKPHKLWVHAWMIELSMCRLAKPRTSSLVFYAKCGGTRMFIRQGWCSKHNRVIGTTLWKYSKCLNIGWHDSWSM